MKILIFVWNFQNFNFNVVYSPSKYWEFFFYQINSKFNLIFTKNSQWKVALMYFLITLPDELFWPGEITQSYKVGCQKLSSIMFYMYLSRNLPIVSLIINLWDTLLNMYDFTSLYIEYLKRSLKVITWHLYGIKVHQ